MDQQIDTSKIQELQILEQNLQALVQQKQATQFEINETNSALDEVSKSKGDTYRVLGNVMIKSDAKELLKELEEKKKVLELRMSSIEKQEKLIGEKHSSIRDEINNSLSKSQESDAKAAS